MELVWTAIIVVLMHLKPPISCILNQFLASLPDETFNSTPIADACVLLDVAGRCGTFFIFFFVSGRTAPGALV